MLIFDDNKIRKAWESFIAKHGLKISEKETSLFPIANKSKKYLAIEKMDEYTIFYKYLYYKLDIGIGNYFKVSIPMDTIEKFCIRRHSIFNRLFTGNSIKIKPENYIELNSSLKELIAGNFKIFSDLEIRTSKYSFHEFGLPQRQIKTLEIHTKYLPTEVIELDSIRDLTLNVFDYFRKQNMIKPLTNIE